MQREYLCNRSQHTYSLVENLLKTMLKAICAKKAEGNLRKKSRQKLFWLLPAEKYALTRIILASREPQI